MLTPKIRARSSASRIGLARSTQIKSSGGDSETEQKALIVEPTGSAPSQVLTMVTPEGKKPIAARHSAGVGASQSVGVAAAATGPVSSREPAMTSCSAAASWR